LSQEPRGLDQVLDCVSHKASQIGFFVQVVGRARLVSDLLSAYQPVDRVDVHSQHSSQHRAERTVSLLRELDTSTGLATPHTLSGKYSQARQSDYAIFQHTNLLQTSMYNVFCTRLQIPLRQATLNQQE
jgi:hypothetical protein